MCAGADVPSFQQRPACSRPHRPHTPRRSRLLSHLPQNLFPVITGRPSSARSGTGRQAGPAAPRARPHALRRRPAAPRPRAPCLRPATQKHPKYTNRPTGPLDRVKLPLQTRGGLNKSPAPPRTSAASARASPRVSAPCVANTSASACSPSASSGAGAASRGSAACDDTSPPGAGSPSSAAAAAAAAAGGAAAAEPAAWPGGARASSASAWAACASAADRASPAPAASPPAGAAQGRGQTGAGRRTATDNCVQQRCAAITAAVR